MTTSQRHYHRHVGVLVILAAAVLVQSPVDAFSSPMKPSTSEPAQNDEESEASADMATATLLESVHSSTNDHGLSYGETSRRFRRTVYTHNDWIRHRSKDRFLGNLVKTFSSGVVRQLTSEVGLVIAISACTCLWNALLVTGYQDLHGVLHEPLLFSSQDVPSLLPQLASLPLEPFTLSSPALGLLLVFRTNASYGRWLEARKAWGAVVNHSRNILRLGAGWVTEESESDPEKRRRALERLAVSVWVFSRSLQRHLMSEKEDGHAYEVDVRESLPPAMAENLIDARHKPTLAMYELTDAVNALPMKYRLRVEVDRSIVALCDAMGACERILSSPVPLVYTRHTARFLGFWTLALPLALWNSFEPSWNHVGLLPASILISFFLFGIEELAIQLEEPFSILPLQQIVNGVRLCADEAVQWHFDRESMASSYKPSILPDIISDELEIPNRDAVEGA